MQQARFHSEVFFGCHELKIEWQGQWEEVHEHQDGRQIVRLYSSQVALLRMPHNSGEGSRAEQGGDGDHGNADAERGEASSTTMSHGVLETQMDIDCDDYGGERNAERAQGNATTSEEHTSELQSHVNLVC